MRWIFLKKPFVSLKSRSDTAKMVLFFLLGLSALMLFFLPDDGIAVFGGDSVGGRVNGIMSVIERNM